MAVSIASPIGKGLLGKKPGEIAIIQAPMGERKLEILEIK
jgi:transcription elongation factor GreA